MQITLATNRANKQWMQAIAWNRSLSKPDLPQGTLARCYELRTLRIKLNSNMNSFKRILNLTENKRETEAAK